MAQVLVNGVFLGCLFARRGRRADLVYGVMEVPELRALRHHGAVGVRDVVEPAKQGHPFVVAAPIGVAVGGILSVFTEVLAYRWVRNNPAAAPAVALGLLLILQNTGVAHLGR